MTRRQIERAVDAGELRRLRRNWYASPGAPADLVSAVLAGGALSGPHLLSRVGGWVPLACPMHVLLFSHHPANTPNVVRHFGPSVPEDLRDRGVVTWQVALGHSLTALDLENGVALVDSLLHSVRTRESPIRAVASEQEIVEEVLRARRGRQLLALSDRRSESGPESLVRLRLTQLGHSVTIQHRLRNNQRFDVLVDGLVGIEIDGKHHGEPRQYLDDHRKSAIAAAEGVLPLRFGVPHVFAEWETIVYPAILRMLELAAGAKGSRWR